LIKSIIQLGNPVLRQVSHLVAATDLQSPELLTLIEDLRDTLRDFQRIHGTGRGIAAVQIGVHKRVIYIETRDWQYTLINPRFIYRSLELFTVWDSCFSYWGIEFKVVRHVEVHIEYLTLSGTTATLRATGDLAELLQHEMEHLDGVTALDQLIPAGNVRAVSKQDSVSSC